MAEPPRGPDAGGPVPVPIDAAARDRVVDLLAHSFAEDRLTEAELETRLDAVYRATSRAELEALVAGLPAPVAPQPTSSLAAPGRAPATGRIRAVFSGQEQSLTVVPRRLKVKARFGYVELDLTRARFDEGVTEIRVRAFMGYVQIRLPPGVRVESTGRGLFGYFSTKGSGSVDPDAPVVRIRGKAIFGFAECWVPSADDGRKDRIGPGSKG